MFKKLLQFAGLTFLIVSFGVAFFSDESLASGKIHSSNNAYLGFLFFYPMVAAIIVWEHNSSRNLKCFAAITGLLGTLALAWTLFSDLSPKMPTQWDYVLVFFPYFFIIATSLSSVLARFSILVWRLLGFLRANPSGHKY
ncbi:MAG: hypothetical protein NBV66_11640 [Burkholderiaceae bacterium]|nr:hypothetical protein [Burkholderiaceae bacterium]